MKKLFALLTVLGMVFFASCGQTPKEAEEVVEPVVEEVVEPVEEVVEEVPAEQKVQE